MFEKFKVSMEIFIKMSNFKRALALFTQLLLISLQVQQSYSLPKHNRDVLSGEFSEKRYCLLLYAKKLLKRWFWKCVKNVLMAVLVLKIQILKKKSVFCQKRKSRYLFRQNYVSFCWKWTSDIHLVSTCYCMPFILFLYG